ncbi:hypothetical protein pgond44_05665 [Psychroflexus gondwanensis ACAM 44]|uniref:Uncharacterized protein n=1 Tax=Psychroflexus gondwanensis ACAM 44 TaxID=1189619 RepID=N1WNZ7_9FLAO|nr:hypothetical protein pgond44_05665 [Psychroflexus gondwanensis ACAM 44]
MRPPRKKNAIKFRGLNFTKDCFNVEIALFSINTIYKVEYGIFEKDSIFLNCGYLMQIKQPKSN